MISTGWIDSVVLAAVFMLGGCASYQKYTVPGGPADFRALGISEAQADELTQPSIARRLARKPLAAFPASIAIVRVQDKGYQSYTTKGYGRGSYSIVTIRDIETDEQFDRISNLPMVNGLATLNRLVMPHEFHSDLEIRRSAATVQSDMVLLYTLDTKFKVDHDIPPLDIITLGLFPDDHARVTCTVSSVLMDTRSGFIYTLVEATAADEQLANAWTTSAAIDQLRRRVEAEAFDELVGEFESAWQSVVQRFGPVDEELPVKEVASAVDG